MKDRAKGLFIESDGASDTIIWLDGVKLNCVSKIAWQIDGETKLAKAVLEIEMPMLLAHADESQIRVVRKYETAPGAPQVLYPCGCMAGPYVSCAAPLPDYCPTHGNP